MEARRPNPDALLAQVAEGEARDRAGKLKVFLGAAPGVGKTYAMLGAARDLRKRGVDVIVGIVETHGRQETEALIEGLEVVPRRQLDYKGKVLEELDLDAVLRRRPRVALVDELAHSNVPGSRHQRRYQDIEELLDAGIDVYTTINVQHLESLNDVVERITGVRVRETVPDAFLDRLRDIVLIDLPPRELIERLQQGKVYLPEQAKAALQKYFSPSNLTALRELAMQTAADRVDADLRGLSAGAADAATAAGAAMTGQIRRRVLVAVDGHAYSEYLVRMARRFAERRQAPWVVAYVETGGRSRTDREKLQAAFHLAQRLGAETVTLRGGSVADELLSFANRNGVSSIILGRTRERPLARILNRTITQQLLRKGAHFELTIVNTPYARKRSRRRLAAGEPGSARWREYAVATGVIGLAVLLSWGLQGLLPVASLALVFISAVLVVAATTGTAVAVYTALACFLAYNFFFTEPRLTLRISRAEDLVAVFAFLVAALVCGQLAARLRARIVMLRAANDHARVLQGLGAKLAAAADDGQVFRAGAEAIAAALGCECVVLCRESAAAGSLRQASAEPPGASLAPNDLAAADWVALHAQPAGRHTDTLSASSWWFVPMVVEGGCLGTVGMRFPPNQTRLADEQHQLAEALVQQMALAADRTRLVSNLERARVEGETEQLRTALLSSVSHDLRSPLAAVIGAATTLSAYSDTMPAGDRKELLDSIRSEGERLDRYIQNLLDMTRLGSGGLRIERDWVGLEEILGSALGRLHKLFPAAEVRVELAPDLPPLWVHPALIEQALFNILENAAKFSPEAEPVVVSARRAPGRADSSAGGRSGELVELVIDIADRGAGIPEAERKRIFDLFYSAARGDRGPRGTGLGLTIVRGMIGAHGGRVEALAGKDGVGTTIRVTLPLIEPARDAATHETA